MEIGPWNGMAPQRWEEKLRQLPSFSGAHGAGESLDSKRENVVCIQGKAGLTEATSSQTISTASLTAPLGCNGKKVHGALGMCIRGKGTEFLLFFFSQECFKKSYSLVPRK